MGGVRSVKVVKAALGRAGGGFVQLWHRVPFFRLGHCDPLLDRRRYSLLSESLADELDIMAACPGILLFIRDGAAEGAVERWLRYCESCKGQTEFRFTDDELTMLAAARAELAMGEERVVEISRQWFSGGTKLMIWRSGSNTQMECPETLATLLGFDSACAKRVRLATRPLPEEKKVVRPWLIKNGTALMCPSCHVQYSTAVTVCLRCEIGFGTPRDLPPEEDEDE